MKTRPSHRSRSMGRARQFRLLLAGAAPFLILLSIVMLWLAETPAAAQDGSGAPGLSVASALILGLVEGITEYLPISSTGHLLVTEELLDLGGTEAADLALDTYAICIQAGAIAAVLVLYRNRVGQMFDGVRGRNEEGKDLVLAIGAAFVPTVIIALALQDTVRDKLFGPGPIATAWIVGGLAILVVPKLSGDRLRNGELSDLTVVHAVWIGVAQTLALWPGVSRSLVTIAAALAVGLSLKAAVEFSFLLGLLTLGAATAFEAMSNGSNLIDTFGILTPAIGLVMAFLSAVVAVRWMVTWLEQRSFAVFGWYRLAAGIGLIVLMGTNTV
jgi:undecaprenyl-diphosphatase